MTSSLRAAPALVARFGDVLLRHQAAIRRLQWVMVALYAVLLTVPLLLPLPTHTDYVWNNAVRFAQFVFWGVWWPFIILATALVGRFWCGILCPEGALSEFASQRGAGRAIPGWMKWSGWPVVSFISTTVYGQLTSIYQVSEACRAAAWRLDLCCHPHRCPLRQVKKGLVPVFVPGQRHFRHRFENRAFAFPC